MSDAHRTEDLKLQRYRLVGSRSNEGSVIDLPRGDGEWVKYEDFKGVIAFANGYLLEHRGMLEHMRVHQKILDAIKHLEDVLEAL